MYITYDFFIKITIFLYALSVYVGFPLIGTVQANQLVAMLCLIQLPFLMRARHFRLALSGRELFYIVLLFLLWFSTIASAINSPSYISTFRVSVSYILGAVFLIFALQSRVSNLYVHVANSLLISAAITGLISLFDFYTGALGHWSVGAGARFQGMLNNPNQAAMMYVAILPIGFAKLLMLENKVYTLLVCVPIMLCVLQSSSNINVLLIPVALVLVSCTVLFSKKPGLGNRNVWSSRIIAFFLVVIVAMSPIWAFTALEVWSPRVYNFIQVLIYERDRIYDLSTASSRIETWRLAVDIGLRNPIFGYGAGVSWGEFAHAHNVLLDYFASRGFLGLFSIICFLSYVVFLSLKTLYIVVKGKAEIIGAFSSIGASVGMLGFVISNQFSDSMRSTTIPMLWLLMSIIFLFERHRRRSIED